MSREDRAAEATARLVRLREDDGSFDRAFWATMSASERLEATWGLALTYLALTRPDAGESRLQRSVCRVERRGR